MNKSDIISRMSEGGDITKADAERAVNSVLQNIKKNTKKGVQLIGFGSFSVAKRKARKGRNPQTGEVIKIKASKTVKFRPGTAYKGAI